MAWTAYRSAPILARANDGVSRPVPAARRDGCGSLRADTGGCAPLTYCDGLPDGARGPLVDELEPVLLVPVLPTWTNP